MKCGYIPLVFLLNMLILSIMYISEILFLPRTRGVGHYAVIKYVIFDKFVIFEMKYTTKPSLSQRYFYGFRYYNGWSVNIKKQIHGIPKALEENAHRKCLKMICCVVLSHDFQPWQRYPTGFLQFFISFHACNQETTKILMGKCRLYCNFPFENASGTVCFLFPKFR